MTYLIMVLISKFRSRMDGCALHVYPGHLIPYVQRRLLPGVSTRVVYHMQGTCMEDLKAGTVRDTPTREVGGAQRFSQHLLTASPITRTPQCFDTAPGPIHQRTTTSHRAP